MSSFSLPPGFRPSNPSSSSSSNPQQNAEQEAAQREKQEQEGEMKRGMMAAMLEPAARERLSRISLTRPQLASQVTDLLVRMGQQGQVRGQVTDEALKGLLEQVSNPPKPEKPAGVAPTMAGPGRTKSLGGGITIQRKRDDSDSDEYDL